jgi:hypothetical protein
MEKSVLLLASKINKSLLAGYEEYLEACESHRRDGHRPHYCEHGTNNWTDYDNICGGCEDGISMGDPLQRREAALDSAKRRSEKAEKIMTAIWDLKGLGVILDNGPAWDEVVRLLTVE